MKLLRTIARGWVRATLGWVALTLMVAGAYLILTPDTPTEPSNGGVQYGQTTPR